MLDYLLTRTSKLKLTFQFRKLQQFWNVQELPAACPHPVAKAGAAEQLCRLPAGHSVTFLGSPCLPHGTLTGSKARGLLKMSTVTPSYVPFARLRYLKFFFFFISISSYLNKKHTIFYCSGQINFIMLHDELPPVQHPIHYTFQKKKIHILKQNFS